MNGNARASFGTNVLLASSEAATPSAAGTRYPVCGEATGKKKTSASERDGAVVFFFQPFSPVCASPWTNCFCANRNTSSTGTT
ncbi:MAG: hypothetical protein ACTH07_06295, partial [Microbacterium sp.]